MKSYRFIIKGLDCANCAREVEEHLQKMDKYQDVVVNFATSKISLKANETKNIKANLQKEIRTVESGVTLHEVGENIQNTERTSTDISRIALALLIFGFGIFADMGRNFANICLIIALVLLLCKTTKKAIIQLLKNKVLDENMLIVISCIGAYFVNKGFEAIMVITLYEIGKILESKAINTTRKSISDLMDIKPQYANLRIKGRIKKVDPEKVKVGDTIVIKVGEKIPLDGVVIKGETELDNSALTGETKYVRVRKNSTVISGGINVAGIIEVKVNKTYEDSTVSQILNLVENATDKKAKTETFVAKVAKIYTPIVIFLAILVAIGMPIIFSKVNYSESIYKALIFLVISCPCSIAISVPLSYFTGIGRASKKGILIKGSDYLDGIKDVKKIIFDKTGTITTGKFVVTKFKILDNNYTKKQILTYLGVGESLSKHPLAESIVRKVKAELRIEDIDTKNVTEFKEVSGKGIQYKYDGKLIKVGNLKFISRIRDNIAKENNKEKVKLGTTLYVKADDDIIGEIVLSDQIKKGTKSTIQQLHKKHIITKMFTGDKKEIADKIGKEIGIGEVKSEMLPTDKYKALEQELKTSEKVAYVGDGINDSPVLARADIGISMGGIGSSSAIEASDVVIMTDEINKIVDAINISKKTNKIIKQNLVFAISIKIIIMILDLFGLADMWQAVFADVGVTLITIFNTIRI